MLQRITFIQVYTFHFQRWNSFVGNVILSSSLALSLLLKIMTKEQKKNEKVL